MKLIVIISLVFIVAFELYVSKALFGNVFSPLTVFTVVNASSFSLYCLNYADYVAMNDMVVLVLMLDILFFAFGAFFADALSKRIKKIEIISILPSSKIDIYIIIVFWIATISFIIMWNGHINEYGFSYLSNNVFNLQESLRSGFSNARFIGNFALLNEFILPLVTMKAYSYKRIGFRDVLYSIISLICLLLLVKKTYVICSITMTIAVILRFTQRFLRVIKFISFAFLLVLISFSANTFLLVANAKETIIYYVYIYFSGTWAALGELLKKHFHESAHFGQYTLHSIYKILELFGLAEAGKSEMPGVYIPFWYNAYTMNGEVYVDFGYIGILLQAIFLGYLIQRLYRENLRRVTVFNTVAYCIMFHCVALSWFVSEITHFSFLFQLVFMFLLSCIIENITIKFPITKIRLIVHRKATVMG